MIAGRAIGHLALPGRFCRPEIRSGRAGLRGAHRAWLRVPAEPEPVEHEARVPVPVPDRRRNRLVAPEDEANRPSSQAAEVLRAMPAADPALVLVPGCGVIEDAMDALTRPVRAIEGKEGFGAGGPRRVARDAGDDLDARLAKRRGLSVPRAAVLSYGPLDHEDRLDPRAGDPVYRIHGDPDRALLDLPVLRLR